MPQNSMRLPPLKPHMASSLLFLTASPVLQEFFLRRFNTNKVTLSSRPRRILPQNQRFRWVVRGSYFSTGHEHNVLIIARQPPTSPINTTRSFDFPLNRDASFASPFIIVRKIAYDILFPLLIIFVTIWLTSTLLRRLQRKQLSAQKSQPQPIQFNLLVDLDSSADPFALDEGDEQDTVPRAENKVVPYRDQILDIDHQETAYNDKNPRRGYEGGSIESKNRPSSKPQLKIFRRSNDSNESVRKPLNQGPPLKASTTEPVETVGDDYEAIFVSALIDAMTIASDSSINDGERKASDVLLSTLQGINISNSLKSSITMNVVSRLVSTAVDDVVSFLDTRDAHVMAALGALSNTMRAAQVVAPGVMLNYVGSKLGTDASLEDIYRRYAVYCMSTEQRLEEDLESLNQMRCFLDIRESKAKEINEEIASGMYQVAVSAAMASGSISDEDRRRLETLRTSFDKLLADKAADSITSEVMVMRVMYALQQLVQEEDMTDQDVRRLRKMCQDLGGDVEEVVRKADALGNALGVEVKDFSMRLRSVLLGSRVANRPPPDTTMP